MSKFTPAMVDLLNKCEPPARVVAHCVPMCVIRVLQVSPDARTFRVERLVEHSGFNTHSPRGTWTLLSTHSDAREGAAYPLALDAAWKEQGKIVAQRKKRMIERAKLVRSA